MNRKTYSEILDSVARDHLPANPDLAPQIRSRIQKGKGFAMQPRMKIVATVILVLLILALVLVSAPAVAAAIQHWFGYVPGFGLVREGGIRQLAAPVAVEREGITITVERALLDSEKTMILFKVENLPAPAFPAIRSWRSASRLRPCVCRTAGSSQAGKAEWSPVGEPVTNFVFLIPLFLRMWTAQFYSRLV